MLEGQGWCLWTIGGSYEALHGILLLRWLLGLGLEGDIGAREEGKGRGEGYTQGDGEGGMVCWGGGAWGGGRSG